MSPPLMYMLAIYICQVHELWLVDGIVYPTTMKPEEQLDAVTDVTVLERISTAIVGARDQAQAQVAALCQPG